MKACLLGSTGVVVETSRLQRLAYNAAFEELGLDLYWNVAAYCSLLKTPGEIRRLELALGDEAPVGLADEALAMQRKHFTRIAEGGLQLRPGVADVIGFCKRNDIRLGWVTTEDSALVDLLLERTVGIGEGTFDMVLSEGDVRAEKPDPAIYHHALSRLGERPANVIAVEDTALGQAAALEAELQCYLYGGEYAMLENNVLATRDIHQTITRAHSLWGRSDDLPNAMAMLSNANL
ncbi:MAG: beta-phosphoglucomutase-like phosphatase (HAD superfamily) [Glaciecola sp.]|jgi:beta-phosphoglucomutase-like phosphatase (HAD superfamily)|uniref:HAD-IA family hydrolase n=1 Tax=Congregibacter sp. TaxID=2744308 RepID=UPI0039E37B9E